MFKEIFSFISIFINKAQILMDLVATELPQKCFGMSLKRPQSDSPVSPIKWYNLFELFSFSKRLNLNKCLKHSEIQMIINRKFFPNFKTSIIKGILFRRFYIFKDLIYLKKMKITYTNMSKFVSDNLETREITHINVKINCILPDLNILNALEHSPQNTQKSVTSILLM